MKLQNILVINRAPFNHLELNLGDEQINVLSGINGSGKTTLISYIVDAFYELAKAGFRQEFKNIDNQFYRISSDLFSVDKGKQSVVYLRFKQDDGSYSDYIDIRGIFSPEDYDSLISIPDKISYSNIKHYIENDKLAKYWTITDKHTVESLFFNNLLTYFPAYRYEIPYYLNDPYKIHLDFTKDMKILNRFSEDLLGYEY